MKFVLYSSEEYLTKALGECLAKERKQHRFFCYTDMTEAKEKLKSEQIDIVLHEEGKIPEDIPDGYCIAMGAHTRLFDDDKSGELNIYQKKEDFLNDFDRLLQWIKGENGGRVGKKESIFSFFSTEGGGGKTTLSYLTAVLCAQHKKTLYINMEPLAVTARLYSCEYATGMENLLLAFRNHTGKTAKILMDSVRRSADGVYTLPTLQNLGDHLELNAETFLKMIRQMVATEGIEIVILDFPSCFSEMTKELLQISERIIWVYSASMDAQRKMEMVHKDPYLLSEGYFQKSIFVRNKYEVEVDPGENVAIFPMLGSLKTLEYISAILDRSAEFKEGCQQIIKSAGML